jgi:NaMN:DMB phosphoribosyltransferase
MRLGEGTGAALGLLIIEAAVRLHNENQNSRRAN